VITDYKGASNSSELWQYLVGETIIGTFQEQRAHHTTVKARDALGRIE